MLEPNQNLRNSQSWHKTELAGKTYVTLPPSRQHQNLRNGQSWHKTELAGATFVTPMQSSLQVAYTEAQSNLPPLYVISLSFLRVNRCSIHDNPDPAPQQITCNFIFGRVTVIIIMKASCSLFVWSEGSLNCFRDQQLVGNGCDHIYHTCINSMMETIIIGGVNWSCFILHKHSVSLLDP